MSRAQGVTMLAFVVLWLLTYAFFHPAEWDGGTLVVIKLPW